MKCIAWLIFLLVFSLATVNAQAKEINAFTISDGQATYTFALGETGMRLFFYSYQNSGYTDMKNRVFTYAVQGVAPLDNLVMREEIAKAVKGLFFNELIRIDGQPVALPLGITCYPAVPVVGGESNDGLGLRFKVADGKILAVEAAASPQCVLQKEMVEGYEAKRSTGKGKKKK